MEKFDSKKHGELLKRLPPSYFSTAIHADCVCYVFRRNGEDLIIWQDVLYPHDFPCMFPPRKKENWERCSVTFATTEFLAALKRWHVPTIATNPIGEEFFYETRRFVQPTGSVKRDTKLFQAKYTFSLKHTCDREQIVAFYHDWKNRKKRTGVTFDQAESFFFYCLDNLNRYHVRQVYVFVGGALVGFAWGVKHSARLWVGLHLKINYDYKGLSRFLHHERAKLFAECPAFTLGTGAHEPGIVNYKKELKPSKIVSYTYVLTGDRK